MKDFEVINRYFNVLVLYRKKSSEKSDHDHTMSVSVAHRQVKLEPGGGEGGRGGVYENPDKSASTGQGNYELVQCPAYEPTSGNPCPTE